MYSLQIAWRPSADWMVLRADSYASSAEGWNNSAPGVAGEEGGTVNSTSRLGGGGERERGGGGEGGSHNFEVLQPRPPTFNTPRLKLTSNTSREGLTGRPILGYPPPPTMQEQSGCTLSTGSAISCTQIPWKIIKETMIKAVNKQSQGYFPSHSKAHSPTPTFPHSKLKAPSCMHTCNQLQKDHTAMPVLGNLRETSFKESLSNRFHFYWNQQNRSK